MSNNPLTLDAEHTRLLSQHEAVIAAGFDAMIDAVESLIAIRDERLYVGLYPSFEAYCSERWGKQISRFRQLRLYLDTRNEIKQLTGIDLPTESASRKLRRYPVSLQSAIVELANGTALALGRTFNGGDIVRAGDVLTEAVKTGHVDTGNGQSTSLNAAMEAADFEARERRKQYQREADHHDTPAIWIKFYPGYTGENWQQMVDRLPVDEIERLRDKFLGS